MISLPEIRTVLENNNPAFIENLARQAKQVKEQYFGRTVVLYAPLYLSNYCTSHCTYCGFHSHNRIQRFKLTLEEMHPEMEFLSRQGIENILLLTGESYKATPLTYLKEAVHVAKQYFPSISLEVHPMNADEYKELFQIGVDGITVYQETYDEDRYHEVHITGKKADYYYRQGTPERAARGGIRSISMGILLGLATDVAKDVHTLYEHLRLMEKNYPGIEYSLSFPRFQPIKGEDFAKVYVDDKMFTQIICLTRILFPRIGINLSTREQPHLRDSILELGITRMSAGSNTSVGGYTLKTKNEQDPQFDIQDHRSIKEIVQLLKSKSFDPVFTDWRRIENTIA